MKKKILILGSNGLLGSYLSNNLKLDKKFYKIIPAHLIGLRLINLKKKKNLLDKVKPDLIINCSAYTNVDLCEKNKILAMKLNCKLIKDLAIYLEKRGGKLIHFSTDYVFDGRNKFYEPRNIRKPLNYYGITKKCGEDILINSKCNYIIIRISWLLSNHKLSFLNKIKNKIKNKKDFRVISNSFSCPTTVILIRKFLEINIRKIFKKNINGLFHLRNNRIMSFYDLSILIQKIIRKSDKNKYVQK